MKSLCAAAVLFTALVAPEVVEAASSLGKAKSKTLMARSRAAAGLPDPKCATGVISLKAEGKPQVCCAGYCGECTDYPTCGSVRGQNSTFACCESDVRSMECGKGAPANVCLKKCSEAVPPCIMDDGEVFTTPNPDTRTAGSDCNEAVADWRKKAKAATEPQGSN